MAYSFICKNGSQRYKYIVVNNTEYIVIDESDSPNKYSETDFNQMVEFLIDNIYVEFGGDVYQQTVDIQMGTNCAPLVADLFLYSYESDFVQHLQKSKLKKQKTSFNLTFHYIEDVLSLNNPKFNDYIDVIYPKELEIKDITVPPHYRCSKMG